MPNANTFEEIGLMRSVGSSTSDLESVDLANSDQHSNSFEFSLRSEKSATTMTSSAKSEQLEFELAWTTRDEIICNLNRHTKLLSGLIVNAEAREKMRKENNELVTALMNLPVKVDGRLKNLESPERSPDEGVNEVVLDLSLKVRSRILDALTINHSVSLMEADTFSSERKAKLIDQNNELAYELLKLKARTVAVNEVPDYSSIFKDDDLIDSKEELDELNKPKSKPIADELATLKEELKKLNVQDSAISSLEENVRDLEEQLAESKDELEELKDELEAVKTDDWVISDLKTDVRGLKKDLTASKGELEKLKNQVSVNSKLKENVQRLTEELAELRRELKKHKDRVGEVRPVCGNETSFVFQLKGIEAVLAGGCEVGKWSRTFSCGVLELLKMIWNFPDFRSLGVLWCLDSHRMVRDDVEYLACYLHTSKTGNGDDIWSIWSITASFELRLLNSNSVPVAAGSPVGDDVVAIFKDRVFKNSDKFTGFGWPTFIPVKKLRSGSFIQNDTIKLQVHLSTKGFERITNY